MALSKPLRHIIRPFIQNTYEVPEALDYDGYRHSRSYVDDDRNTPDRINYIRAFQLIEVDVLDIFDYVDPADANLATHSHKIYQLLIRACTEFESNAKQVLRANDYQKKVNWNIHDYFKLEKACRLSEYGVISPAWSGTKKRVFEPFKAWRNKSKYHPLDWYQAYNRSKHNRATHFHDASLENALNAVAAVFIILFAQYYTQAFDPYRIVNMYTYDPDGGFFPHLNAHFHIRLPTGWSYDEMYDFDWTELKEESYPFQHYPFK